MTPLTATCPYCRTPVLPEDDLLTCPACHTPHHADCFHENGGCTIFGCSQAPTDEPKISITPHELSAPAHPGTAAHPPTPPPPRLAAATPPPPRPTGTVPPRHLSLSGYGGPILPRFPSYLPRKSRLVYVLLGIFLGAFGGHNFYAGYIKRAIIQLSITLFTCFTAAIVSWIWAIIEICVVDEDEDGIAFI